MNIIFIGSCYPEGMQSRLIRLGSVVDFAGHTFQTALLSGLDIYYPDDLKVISSALTSSYPKVKKMNFEKVYFSHNNRDKKDVYVGSLNIPLFKLFSKFLRIKVELNKSLKEGEENIVIVYSTHTPFILPTYLYRKRIDKLVIVVPDLPEFMGEKLSGIRGWLKKIDIKLMNHCLKKYDGFILLSSYMREKLPVGDKPWLQFEGIYKVPEVLKEKIEKEKLRTIMYTGNIYRKRGIDILLRAFEKIDKPNYRLWIRGNGDMKQEILDMSKKDSRIVYFEPVERDELLRMEMRATVMVNPTPASWEFTKFFFPSKTMEYMASGTPTLMFHLACLPKEYEPYVFFADENENALKDKLIEICETPQDKLNEFGKAASEFVIQKKNAEVQAGRLVEMINIL